MGLTCTAHAMLETEGADSSPRVSQRQRDGRSSSVESLHSAKESKADSSPRVSQRQRDSRSSGVDAQAAAQAWPGLHNTRRPKSMNQA